MIQALVEVAGVNVPITEDEYTATVTQTILEKSLISFADYLFSIIILKR